MTKTQTSDFLLSFGEVGCGFGRVRDGIPGDDRDDDGREALDEEEETPGSDGTELGKGDDEVGQC